MAAGLSTPISVASNKEGSGVLRYPETLMLISDAYKEQQYWLSVYNYVQQFGSPNISVQDVITQLTRVSQKLQNYQNLILPAAQSQLQNDNQGNRTVSQLFQNQQR